MSAPTQSDPLIRFMIDPQRSGDLSLKDWDRIVREARANNLLSRIASIVEVRDLWPTIPAEVRPHLTTGLQLARKHKREVTWEARKIQEALAGVETELILLKGAAYLAAKLAAGDGRIFTDIDIMVRKQALPAAEAALLHEGWVHLKHDPYDQHYYRAWTHQLPPLQHATRHTVIDVHHTIVPEMARIALPVDALFAASVAVETDARYRVLCPEDMVLHSAVHLFNDGDFSHGLRDLLDLKDLIVEFSQDPTYWGRLEARALELDLRRPLAYALWYLERIFELPQPPDVREKVAEWLPRSVTKGMTEALFDRALRPSHQASATGLISAINWALEVRGHHLRMPPLVLLPHLFRKMIKGSGAEGRPEEPPVPGRTEAMDRRLTP